MQQEVSGDGSGGLLMQFDEGELRGAIGGDEHVQLALLGAHLGDVDVEVADRIGLELLLRRPVAFDSRQAADAATSIAAGAITSSRSALTASSTGAPRTHWQCLPACRTTASLQT